MESIKSCIIKFIESQGHASKTQICDYLRDVRGTLGETTGRRIRELIKDGVLVKMNMHNIVSDKRWVEYSVVEEDFWGKNQVEEGLEAGRIKNAQLNQEIEERRIEQSEKLEQVEKLAL